MAAFPTTLPRPISSSYTLNPVTQTVRTEMEGGSTRTRRRTTARIDKIGMAFNFTSSEMSTFRDWFDSVDGANGGAGWFNIYLLDGDSGYVEVEAKFSDIWQSVYVPIGHWQVTLTLEVRYA